MAPAQCATGIPVQYGDYCDFNYTDNTSWNHRRAMLTAAGGAANVAAAQWITTALDRSVPFEDTGGGILSVPYDEIDFIFFAGLLPFFEDGLLDRNPLFAFKLDHISYIVNELNDAGELPKGPLAHVPLARAVAAAIAKLPADKRLTGLSHIIPCEDSSRGAETVWERMTVREIAYADHDHGGALARALRGMLVGALVRSEREDPDGIAATIAALLGPKDDQLSSARKRAPLVLGWLSATMPPPRLETFVPREGVTREIARRLGGTEEQRFTPLLVAGWHRYDALTAAFPRSAATRALGVAGTGQTVADLVKQLVMAPWLHADAPSLRVARRRRAERT